MTLVAWLPSALRVQNDSLQTWQKIEGSAVTQGVTECTVNKTPAH
jgi:hypothetical protein